MSNPAAALVHLLPAVRTGLVPAAASSPPPDPTLASVLGQPWWMIVL